MVLLARKNESTSEKIVRLYKEGYNPDEISRLMEIPKGNIPNILEKHFPDYQSYVQPERKHDPEPEKGAKKGGIGGFFGRGKKEDTADASSSMLNLDMDDEGFIDRSVAGIASMIKKGRSSKDICAFLNCTPADVEAMVDSYPWDYKLIYSKDHFNPIPAFVKLAKRLYVTAESTGMLSEACTFGSAEVVALDNLNPGPHKFRRFVENLRAGGYVDGCRKIDLSAQFACARELMGL